ncbi:head-tail connector protein [Paracraurococcus ruber]|nr:hypothetical protein [Paracraurococcus ruber]
MDLRLITPATSEPLSEAVAMDHCRANAEADGGAEFGLFGALITAAREQVEAMTGRLLRVEEWELRLPCFPACGRPIQVPHAPFVSLTSLSTVSAAGVTTTLAGTAYQVEAPTGPAALPATIWSAANTAWPSTDAGVRGAVRVRYRAGYDTPPKALLQAMLLLIGAMYENREAEVETRASAARALNSNPAFDRLIAPYRILAV